MNQQSLKSIALAGRRAMAEMYERRHPYPPEAPAAPAPGYQWVQATPEEWDHLQELRERGSRRLPEAGHDMGQHWSVSISRNDDAVLTIGSDYVQGSLLTEENEALILGCIRHLQSFIGDRDRQDLHQLREAFEDLCNVIGVPEGTRFVELPALAKKRIGLRAREATEAMVNAVRTKIHDEKSTAPRYLRLLWTLMWDAAEAGPSTKEPAR